MSSNFSRRRILTAGAGAALGAAAASTLASPALAQAPGRFTPSAGPEETRSLDKLYRSAIAEGGKLVVYGGGDIDSQADGIRAGFRSRFPKIDLTIVVDYSKFHDVRVDNQFATGTLVPDVVQLQTLQDFTRWKRQGQLLPYKPAGFSKLHPQFRDPDGAWTAVQVVAFSFLYDAAAAGAHAPRTPQDLVDPRWKDAIASSYPHDDDAVLYLFALYQQAYGWDWIAKFAAQQPRFARGSHTPFGAVLGRQKTIGVGTSASLLAGPDTMPRTVVADGHPFMAWGQRTAILKRAARPAAAKLYLNWLLSTEVQRQSFNGWSVRTDVTPTGGPKPIWQYPNAHLDGFPKFMEDRAQVERLKQTFALYFGEVQGAPTPGSLGLRPGR